MTVQGKKKSKSQAATESSADVACAEDPQAHDPQRGRAQQLLQNERERIRRIESTLSELIQELADELLTSESRLAQLASDLDERTSETDALRAEITALKNGEASTENAAAGGALLAPDSTRSTTDDQRVANAEFATPESQTEQEELRRQLAKAHKQLNLRAQELNELRAQLVEASLRGVGGSADAGPNLTYELADLRAERQMLVERLADAESRLSQLAQIDLTEVDNQRRRFEMAVQDVRELKQLNSQLESELGKYKKPGVAAKPGASNNSDWEAKKQALLAQLESESGEINSQERLSIEGTLHITDDVIAQKEQEIAELRRILSDHDIAANLSALDADAMTALVDKDEVILHQRENLRRMEAEAREKHRKAEIELSVERAKLARERALFEDRIRSFEKEQSQLTGPGEKESGQGGKPAKGGRWLARLGLKEDKS